MPYYYDVTIIIELPPQKWFLLCLLRGQKYSYANKMQAI